ncbi:MAG: DUF4861 family protein [Bergeyella sp.]
MRLKNRKIIKRSIGFAVILSMIISCSVKKNTAHFTGGKFSYAELSVKKGGHWEGRKYIGGTFENVSELDLPKQHTDHSFDIRYEGPGLENNQIAYRLYLDWRNATDIFGKKVDSLVLPNVGQDGFDSYHEDADWGQDILKAGKSLGIGSYGRYEKSTSTVHPFKSVENTFTKIENSKTESSVSIYYKGWKMLNDNINLKSKLTIFPYDRFVKVDLSSSQNIDALCTGIVYFKDIPMTKSVSKSGKWAYISTYGKQTLTDRNDTLGMAIFYKVEDVQELTQNADNHLIIFKPTTKKLTYYFLGAWSDEPNGIKNKSEFLNDLNKKLDKLDKDGKL